MDSTALLLTLIPQRRLFMATELVPSRYFLLLCHVIRESPGGIERKVTIEGWLHWDLQGVSWVVFTLVDAEWSWWCISFSFDVDRYYLSPNLDNKIDFSGVVWTPEVRSWLRGCHNLRQDIVLGNRLTEDEFAVLFGKLLGDGPPGCHLPRETPRRTLRADQWSRLCLLEKSMTHEWLITMIFAVASCVFHRRNAVIDCVFHT